MRAVFISNHDNPDDWIRALEHELPDLNVEVWPQVNDLEKIEVAVVWKPPHGVLARFPNLRLICALGMGVDFLFVDPELPAVPLVRLIDPDLVAQMSEYVCAVALWQLRRFDDYAEYQRQRQWRLLPPPQTAAYTIGILGLGEIGQDTARKLLTLGFPVRGWSRTSKQITGVTHFHGEEQFDEFLRETRVLVCLLPLTDATRGIINQRALEQLPHGAYLINVARGGHVVEEDLLAAIDSGHIAGATLDVFGQEPLPAQHPFWTHSAVRMTPHIAGLTRPNAAAPQIADNIRRLYAGRALNNQVDFQRQY